MRLGLVVPTHLDWGARALAQLDAILVNHAQREKKAAGSAVRAGGLERLVDRLLVAALIEARSCERFALLAEAVAPRDGRSRPSTGGSARPRRATTPPTRGSPRASSRATRCARWRELAHAEAEALGDAPAPARLHG
jgi:tRNA-(ms[2]io[6]A)-hydroxylase